MITYYIPIVATLLASLQTRDVGPDWAAQALAHAASLGGLKQARPPSKLQGAPGPVPVSGKHGTVPGSVTFAGPDPDTSPELAEQVRLINKNSKYIGWLLGAGRYTDSYKFIESLADKDPRWKLSYMDLLLTSEFFTARKQDAYEDIVWELNEPGAGRGDYWLLQLSLLSAEQGQVYPGQLDFCKNFIRSSSGMLPQVLRFVPVWSGDSPKDVAVASSLALGLFDKGYYGEALRLDPLCIPAAHELANDYIGEGKFQLARKISRSMLAKVGGDSEPAKWFTDILNKAGNRRDLHLPPKPSDGGIQP